MKSQLAFRLYVYLAFYQHLAKDAIEVEGSLYILKTGALARHMNVQLRYLKGALVALYEAGLIKDLTITRMVSSCRLVTPETYTGYLPIDTPLPVIPVNARRKRPRSRMPKRPT